MSNAVELRDVLDSGDIKEIKLGETKIVRILGYPLEDRSPSRDELEGAYGGVPDSNILALLRDDDSKRLFLTFYDSGNDEWYFSLLRRAR